MLSGSWQPPTEKTTANTDKLLERCWSLAPDALRESPKCAAFSHLGERHDKMGDCVVGAAGLEPATR